VVDGVGVVGVDGVEVSAFMAYNQVLIPLLV
jgi:hypothetical protein